MSLLVVIKDVSPWTFNVIDLMTVEMVQMKKAAEYVSLFSIEPSELKVQYLLYHDYFFPVTLWKICSSRCTYKILKAFFKENLELHFEIMKCERLILQSIIIKANFYIQVQNLM